jgi:two-component sensor histidine kinase
MLSNNPDPSLGGGTARPDAWLYLEEITHRTLNDYTAMLAIVRRASLSVGDETSGRALADVAVRLRASATTLQVLRPPREGLVRDLDHELEVLCKAITNALLSPRGITLTLSSEPVTISSYRCWQISLIISELLTNAARHAFRDAIRGSITVDVCVRNDTIQCTIADDGTSRGDATPGRGTAIVNALIDDLGGTIARRFSGAGSAITFTIPLAEAFFRPSLQVQPKTPSPFDHALFNFRQFGDSK